MIALYDIEEAEFPRTGSLEEQFRFLLRYVILAPSTHNTQPWRFGVSPNGIEIFADYTRRLPVADRANRELLMSVGAAIMNLRVAAAHFGFSCRIDYNLSGDSERPVAFATLAPDGVSDPETERLASLFQVIPRRHTNRNPFLVTRIPASVLGQFSAMKGGRSIGVLVSTDGRLNEQVAELVAAAEQELMADPEFRKDNAEWVRPGWTDRADGIPGSALGLGGVAAALAPWATRVLDLGRRQAARDKNLCVEAPGLIVLSCEDTVPEFLETGEVLEQILLTLTREGLQASYFNMLIQSPETRLRLRGLLGISTWPQLLLRIGYCLTEPAVTPRRSVDEMLVSTPLA